MPAFRPGYDRAFMEPKEASASRAVLVKGMGIGDANPAGFVPGGGGLETLDHGGGRRGWHPDAGSAADGRVRGRAPAPARGRAAAAESSGGARADPARSRARVASPPELSPYGVGPALLSDPDRSPPRRSCSCGRARGGGRRRDGALTWLRRGRLTHTVVAPGR